MHILKNFLRGLSSQTLKIALFLVAMSAATVAILSTPEPIKQTLHNSGLYTKVVPSVIESAKQEQAKEQAQKQPGQQKEGGDIDLNDPAIVKAVSDALPPEYLEHTTNTALDGLFAWLNGKTKKPHITIDLTEPKQKLINGIGEVAYAKAATKPVCTVAQLRSMDRNNIDIFNVPCIPPGVDLRAEQAKLVTQMNTKDEFLKDTTLSVDDLDNDGKGGIDFDKLERVPLAFKIFSSSAIIWGVIAVLAAGLLVLLHDERQRAFWVIGRAFVTNGVLLIVVGVVATYLAGQVHPGPENESELVLLVPGIVKDITSQFTKVLYLFGGAYILIGAAIMITLKIRKSETVATSPTKPKPSSASKK